MATFTFNVTILDDDIFEDKEIFKLHINRSLHYQVHPSGSNFTATVNIIDDETRE